ncbi:hypothetical protein [Cardiobacterium valvarum]
MGCSQNDICKALKRYRFTVKKKTSATARQTKKNAVNSSK